MDANGKPEGFAKRGQVHNVQASKRQIQNIYMGGVVYHAMQKWRPWGKRKKGEDDTHLSRLMLSPAYFTGSARRCLRYNFLEAGMYAVTKTLVSFQI